MTEDTVLQRKPGELAVTLGSDASTELWRARANHWTAMTAMIVAVMASVFAGVGGLSKIPGALAASLVALIPGAFAFLSTTIKFDGKAVWHYRKKRELDSLWRQLKF
ncbi:MAG: hypothetical protein WAN12_13290 [Candidatus Acidiferrum sp.]